MSATFLFEKMINFNDDSFKIKLNWKLSVGYLHCYGCDIIIDHCKIADIDQFVDINIAKISVTSGVTSLPFRVLILWGVIQD